MSALTNAVNEEVGGVVNHGVHVVANALMGMTAVSMLDGHKVHFGIEGFRVLLSENMSEAVALAALTRQMQCASRSNRAELAYAYRGADHAIELCHEYFMQPLAPTRGTLTQPDRASQPGIMLHEFTHLAFRARDNRYRCVPTGALGLAMSLIPGAALLNADSYRCWAEDTAVGRSGSSVPR